MMDMSQVIAPKSDQQNADDFVGGPKTFTIERVEIKPVPDQPVSIFLRGENRPWKPCKSMSRLLVAAWGADANQYAGRSVTLCRDPSVKWGGMEVGGIRISHMSHIERGMIIALTKTKGQRAPYTVKPLAVAAGADRAPPATFTLAEIYGPPFAKTLTGIADAIEALEGSDEAVVIANADWLQSLPLDKMDKAPSLVTRIEKLRAKIGTANVDENAPIDDDFPGDRPSKPQHVSKIPDFGDPQ